MLRGGFGRLDELYGKGCIAKTTSDAHAVSVGRLVTLRAAAATGAVALLTSCISQAARDVPQPAVSPVNRAAAVRTTVWDDSQVDLLRPSQMRPGLPTAIMLVTPSGHRYLALPSGRIERIGERSRSGRPRIPAGAVWADAPRAWMRVAARHVELGEGDDVVWRSHAEYDFRSANAIWGGVIYSSAGVAFEVGRGGPLFVGPHGGTEHPVATGEWPVLWTRSGTLLTMGKEPRSGFTMRLRAPDGSLERTLASDLTINEAEAMMQIGNELLYLADGKIWRTDGQHVRAVARLSPLGFTSTPSFYGIGGGLLEVLGDDWHDVILRRDGSVFAEPTPPPLTGYAAFGVNVANRWGTRVAYEIVRESTSVATVYLLREGATRGSAVLRVRHANPCDFPLSWHGSWLLFRSIRGSSYAVPSHGGRPIRLPQRINGERISSVHWASASTALAS